MKLKLSKKQADAFRAALLKEQQTKQAFNIARQQAAEAENSRMNLLDVILDVHNVDVTKVNGQSMNLSADGVLTFGENGNASKRIKETLKRGATKKKLSKTSK